jgi:uncharacterized protein (TIGR00290 family)
MVKRVLVTWSGGKDSTMALDLLMASPEWEVVGLLTTVSSEYDRVSMHGVRRELLLEQASCLGLPLDIVWLEPRESNETYQAKMAGKLLDYRARGVSNVAFGDIFLEELRHYREENLAKLGMEATFPLWGRDTRQEAVEFIEKGFQAIITCVDTRLLGRSFVGRALDEALLRELPDGVDPCGENGEFHTFVYNGPLFRNPIRLRLGEVVEREEGRFLYQELIPAG